MKNLGLIILILFGSISILSQDTLIYTIFDFSQPDSSLYIDTSHVGNLWEIGVPNKIAFDSAYSRPAAICTDLDSSYTIENQSSFIIKIVSVFFATGYIEFYHRYETDDTNAGGFLEISYDDGNAWSNIVDHPFYKENFYSPSDKLFNQEPAFSGNSNGWQKSTMHFAWYLGVKKSDFWPPGWGTFKYDNPDTLLLRFKFVSNEIAQPKAGWIVDNISVLIYDYAGAIENQHIDDFNVQIDQSTHKITINVYNEHTDKYTLSLYDINGRLVFHDSGAPQEVDVSCYSTGIYLVIINTPWGRYFSKKVLIK